MSKKAQPKYLPEELQELVSWSVALLGDVIAETEGAKFFKQIEELREYLKKFRLHNLDQQKKYLDQIRISFEKKDSTELNKIAHAFSLMLELINSCENAYRSHRIENRLGQFEMPTFPKEQNIYWVLTAHPTEARNPLMLTIIESIFQTLQSALRSSFKLEKAKLKGYLHMAWKTHLARTHSPTPIDEGQTLFSVLLRDHIVDTFLKLKAVGYHFTFRTWVGGDKDGHPFVDEKVLLESLHLSRGLLVDFLTKYIHVTPAIGKVLNQLRKVGPSDSKLIHKLTDYLIHDHLNPENELAIEIFDIFPNLLIPIELREDASMIKALLNEKSPAKKMAYPLFRMLKTLKKLSGRGEVSLYSRSLIISMVADAQDVENTLKLVNEVFGKPALKVIPLFENRAALETSAQIVDQFLSVKGRTAMIKKHWENKFEVMVGYSDSSKEMGVLKSRLLVRDCVLKLVPLIKSFKLIPIVFHGSGGSVTRGGGSFREQSSWWPQEAFTHYKATIQGEMVQRSFASSPVVIQNLSHIIDEQNNHAKMKKTFALSETDSQLLKVFSDHASSEYQILVSDPKFLSFVERVTVYSYLKNLTIGSRPSKRKQLNSVSDLRAIPWVLTWTQSRLLMPIWWGIGTSFKNLSTGDKKKLREVFAKDPLCSSFLNQTGYSLAKVEEVIFSYAITQAKHLSAQEKKFWTKLFSDEFRLSVEAVQYLSGQKDLTWFKPWLGESIRYRSPLIHPLNVIQTIGIQRRSSLLIRETTTGIACGMMTTG